MKTLTFSPSLKCHGHPLVLVGLIYGAVPALAALDFKKDIQPVFKRNCYECHSDASGKAKDGYVFDNVKKLAGDIGTSGIIVPGDPSASRLYEVISTPGDKHHMPPNGKASLGKNEIEKIKQWIKDGAALDGSGKKEAPMTPAPATYPAPAATVKKWTDTMGRVIEAAFVKLDLGQITLRTIDGKIYRFALEKLSAASQAQAVEEAKAH